MKKTQTYEEMFCDYCGKHASYTCPVCDKDICLEHTAWAYSGKKKGRQFFCIGHPKEEVKELL